MPLPLLALAAAPAIFQGIKSVVQRRKAKKLKESTFVPPELMMNRDLATQQAYSQRAPGQAKAEENVRRNMANQISAGQRYSGGNVNKQAAITSAATAAATDADANLAAQGAQFSENAFGRLRDANLQIGAQKRQNKNEYNATKAALLGASDQNAFNAINNASTAGILGLAGGSGSSAGAANQFLQMQNPWMSAPTGGNEYNPETGSYYENPSSKWAQKRAARRLKAQM